MELAFVCKRHEYWKYRVSEIGRSEHLDDFRVVRVDQWLSPVLEIFWRNER
jgi:hypothetical protein